MSVARAPDPATCLHVRQRVVVRADGSRAQVCEHCGRVVSVEASELSRRIREVVEAMQQADGCSEAPC